MILTATITRLGQYGGPHQSYTIGAFFGKFQAAQFTVQAEFDVFDGDPEFLVADINPEFSIFFESRST